MKEIKKAELLDFIINKMIEDQKRTQSNNYSYSFITRLFHKLEKEGHPLSEEIIMDDAKAKDLFSLIYFQEFNGYPIIKQNSYGNVAGYAGDLYYNTNDFMNFGGFVKLYSTGIRNQQRRLEKEEYDFKNSRNQARLSTRQLITFWLTFAFSIIALGLSIYSIFCKDS